MSDLGWTLTVKNNPLAAFDRSRLTPSALALLLTLDPLPGGMAEGWLIGLHRELPPADFEAALNKIRDASELYPYLNPRFMNDGCAEVFREVRGLLGQRFGLGGNLSASDLAGVTARDPSGVIADAIIRMTRRLDIKKVPAGLMRRLLDGDQGGEESCPVG